MYGRGGQPPHRGGGIGGADRGGRDGAGASTRYKPHDRRSRPPPPPPPSSIRSMSDLSRYDAYTAEYASQVYRPKPSERPVGFVEVEPPTDWRQSIPALAQGAKPKQLVGSFHPRPPWETVLSASSSQDKANSSKGGYYRPYFTTLGGTTGSGNTAVHFFTEAQEDYLLKLVDTPQVIPWLAEVERKNWIRELDRQRLGDGEGDRGGTDEHRKRKREDDTPAS